LYFPRSYYASRSAAAYVEEPPSVGALLEEELETLEGELGRIGQYDDPASRARRTPVLSRLAVVRWLKQQGDMTAEEFDQTLRRLTNGRYEAGISGDVLGLAPREAAELLERWKTLTRR
jgi:hypothetical protein